MADDYDTKRMRVLDGMKPVERPEHVQRWADEFLAESGAYEPMILRMLAATRMAGTLTCGDLLFSVAQGRIPRRNNPKGRPWPAHPHL